jgi:hypothetical protein
MHCALPAETPPRNLPQPLSLARTGKQTSDPEQPRQPMKEPHEP